MFEERLERHLMKCNSKKKTEQVIFPFSLFDISLAVFHQAQSILLCIVIPVFTLIVVGLSDVSYFG